MIHLLGIHLNDPSDGEAGSFPFAVPSIASLREEDLRFTSPVTFFVGAFCFVVAGGALYFERVSDRKAAKARRFSPDSERTTSQAIRTKNKTGDKTAS